MLFGVIAAVLFLIVWVVRGLYELFDPIHNYYTTFISTWIRWFLIVGLVAFLGFGFIFEGWISRFVFLVGSVAVFIVLTVVDTLYNAFNSAIERKDPYRVLIASTDDALLNDVIDALQYYRMYSLTIVDTIDELYSEASWYDSIIIVGPLDQPSLQSFADSARVQWVQFYHMSDSFLLEDLIARPTRIGPLVTMEYTDSPLEWRWRVIKRAIDIAGSGLWLLLLSPILVTIGIIIRATSSWPAIYTQQRVGKNWELFTFYKFRSMYKHMSVGEEFGWAQAEQLKAKLEQSPLNVRNDWVLSKIKNDPRVTPVWRFLRKTSLDELPTLRSVLIGTMSLVGPRPHEQFEVDRYQPRQKRLLSVKPWITWYAQLFGRHAIAFEEEAKLDLYYIQNRSIGIDLYVLISTAKVVLKGT